MGTVSVCLMFYSLFIKLNLISAAQDVRIINGSLAKDQRQFAYQVSLTKYNQHFCGGVILNLDHILTAAHCIYDIRIPYDLRIRVGSLKQFGFGLTRRVKAIFMHPGFDYDSLMHDVAVLKIDSLGNWTREIRNISLAKSSPIEGTKCTIAGWGVTEESENSSYKLRYTQVPIISMRNCRGCYGKRIKRGMFCAGYLEGGPDACQGDSGGGIVCNNELSGIISWGHKCGEKYYPGVYTDVSYYLDWIKAKSNSSNLSPISHVMFLSLWITYLSL